MTTKIKPFTTDTLDVRWGHLHAPDDKFGADTANHSVTIIVDTELQKQLDQMVKDSGATKVNGMRTEDDGTTTLKAKSKTFTKKGVKVFPCRDAKAQPTEACAFGGDKVRLRLAPTILSRDGSMSVFLNGVQIIEKNEQSASSGGFEATDGFDGADFKAPEPVAETPDEEMDDIPF